MTHRQGFPYRRSRRLRPKDREQSENWMTPALSRRSSSGLNTSGITAPFYAYIIGSVKVADSTGSSDPPISSEDVPGVPVLVPSLFPLLSNGFLEFPMFRRSGMASTAVMPPSPARARSLNSLAN
jgi:hypothetical protein